MKELRRKIFWCLAPVVIGLLVLGIAWYNYSVAPLKIGQLSLANIRFKLGVDLVGGTILVYEIDPEKKPENYDKAELVAALKRRLDPADLYNITIRPASDTRIEIILPTGDRRLLKGQEEAWDELLEAVEEKWGDQGVTRAKLNLRKNDVIGLAIQIKELNNKISGDDVDEFIQEKYKAAKDKQLTSDDVEKFKELIQRVGSLEFRILANRNDDKEAIDAARAYFDKASTSWLEFLKDLRKKYSDVDTPTDADARTTNDVACGDVAELKKLVTRHVPAGNPSRLRDIGQWFAANFNPKEELRSLINRANTGIPPEAPTAGDGRKFRVRLEDDQEHVVTYSWVEIGRNELHSHIRLNNDARWPVLLNKVEKEYDIPREKMKDLKPGQLSSLIRIIVEEKSRVSTEKARDFIRQHYSGAWESAERARNDGKLLEETSLLADDGRTVQKEPLMGSDAFRAALFSRKITNRTRISDKDRRDGKEYEYFFLTRDAEPGKAVTGEYLTSVRESHEQAGGLAVGFNFNSRGANLFKELTTANRPKRDSSASKRNLAVVLDGQIESAPSLNAVISDSGQISGKFSKAQINMLINILRSGALPATLKSQPVSENTMGATLGEDTIRSGTFSIAIAFAAVLIFMLVYYRFAGFVACVALLANLILTIAFMVIVNATFTLPGLAGLVLMLAMAVDANILIYERLREERDRGASLAQALRNGYDRAFPTIIDTHLSSIFTAIVLYVVGNDQLKGFGISLTVGLLISLFTSLYMTKTIFRLWEVNGWLKNLSMARLLSKPNINFMAIRKPVFIATMSLAMLGLVVFLSRGTSSLNMDFVGGTVYSGQLTEFQSIDELRKKLEDESRQKKYLELASDPEKLPDKERAWKLVYKQQTNDADEPIPSVREIRMTEDLSVAEMRQRAEALPEPSLELIFQSSDSELSEGNKSKLFTVRTTEKSADLVAASLGRLLGGLLQSTSMESYTIESVTVAFPKAVTEKDARATVMPVLKRAELPRGDDDVVLSDFKEEGIEKGTYKSMTLKFSRGAVRGDKLLAALQPLTQEDQAGRKKQLAGVQVSAAQLNLSGQAFLSQVKTLLDAQFRGATATQEVGLTADPKKENAGRYDEMSLILPAPVDAGRFLTAMETFGTELVSRPLPVRLENFDSALAASMQQRALYAIIASWAAILMYLWFRFGNWTFGLAAVLCLVHDVCMTLGAIAVAHYLHGTFISSWLGLRDFKLDLPAVAALLTLIGFSVNDTIVVFDRIREVRGKNPHLTPEMINDSINQTLSRTILTSATAWLVVLVLFIWGGEGVHLFAFVMVFGVLVGTMSSIFVASPLLLYLGEGAPKAGTPLRVQEERPTTARR